MIHNEKEYTEAVNRLAEEHARLSLYRKRLTEEGLSAEAVQRVVDPMESFHLQLKEEVESYERLKRRELAKRLGVHESQVSRDERNEYFGITLERAMKVLTALHVHLRTTVQIETPPHEMAAV